MSCCANERTFTKYYSEEARRKANEFADEMAESVIKESETENKEKEIVDCPDEDNQDGGITVDEPVQGGSVIADDPTIVLDNSRRSRKRKKRPKQH